jgi:hypothetical protein
MNLLGQHRSVHSLLGKTLAALLLCAVSTTGHADPQQGQVVGLSPTAYNSPMANAEQELEKFQKLVHLRDTGQLSASDYQRLVMGLAGGNKVVTSMNSPSAVPPIDLIEMPKTTMIPLITPPSRPPLPENPPPPIPTTRRPPPQNPSDHYLRPSNGPVLSVQNKDVADF